MNPKTATSEVSQDINSYFSGDHIKSIGKTNNGVDLATPFRSTSTIKPKVHVSSKLIQKKKNTAMYRKAPQAPKRFKPAYICFSMANHKQVKKELGPNSRVGDISKRISQVWHSLLPNERARWDKEAEEDKKRYELEKADYTGPWKILARPSKVDVNAPKRPMSSFLYYAQKYRQIVKRKNPELCNTEVSKLLGVMWKNAPKEEKQKYIEHEESKRAIYKSAISEWHKKQEEISLIPEHHQEHVPDTVRHPFPYSHQNSTSVERNEYAEEHQQQHTGMRTFYEQLPAPHVVMPPQMPCKMYSQQPPYPSYNDHYEHMHQGYPIPITGNQNSSNNIQQDSYAHNFEAPKENDSIHNSWAPQQEYFAHNSGASLQPCYVHDSASRRHYDEPHNMSQGERGFFNSDFRQYSSNSHSA